jgi:hypothetical protein
MLTTCSCKGLSVPNAPLLGKSNHIRFRHFEWSQAAKLVAACANEECREMTNDETLMTKE